MQVCDVMQLTDSVTNWETVCTISQASVRSWNAFSPGLVISLDMTVHDGRFMHAIVVWS